MRSSRRLAARLLIAIVAMAVVASPANARSGAKAIWGPATVNGVSQFPLYRALGVGILEMQLSWRNIAPTRPLHPRDPNDPAYRWPAQVDLAVSQAPNYNMRVLLMGIGTPTWANGGRPFNWVPRRKADLANFFTAAARRYRSVHLWMVWGEPSRFANFEPFTPAAPSASTLTPAQAWAPHRYAQLLDASYAALKRVTRRNLVIGGNTFTTGDISTRQWIQNMRLPNGHAPRMDLYGHNPLSWRDPNLANPPSPDGEVDFSDLRRLSRLVDRNLAPRHRHIRLFLSEWFVPTAPDNELNIYVTPAVQAQWISDAWRIVRSSPFIYALGWIHIIDSRPRSHGSAGGLLDYRGRPKPGYYAFAAG